MNEQASNCSAPPRRVITDLVQKLDDEAMAIVPKKRPLQKRIQRRPHSISPSLNKEEPLRDEFRSFAIYSSGLSDRPWVRVVPLQKSRNIGESLIKTSILCAAELVMGKDSANKLSQIFLSNDTVKKSIDELSQDIKDQTLNQKNQLSWESLVGVCTNGAPAMGSVWSGSVTKVKEKNPSVMSTHCILHREALAFRTLPAEMLDVLNVAIKVVNFIKAGPLNTRLFKLLRKDMESEHEALLFYTNVRWLSKGNMLGWLYELREEVAIFLESRQTADFHDNFQAEGFQITLVYLVDIFEALNVVNLKIHGKSINTIMHHDTIRAFMAKLNLWKCRVQPGNGASFRNLDSALAGSNLDSDLKQHIITHLSDLKTEFIRYFPDIDDKREA
ncbi:zinc finger BED domain-containing protein 5-like [Palaemon carinicauda]|uniref:zinc finger BED domain-containing protein 5-like n=1 Tax=Palaemon carinicauda TaxID=392227 RepID=UPI0035B5CA48